MERIKRLNDVVLAPNGLLAEIIEIQAGNIILPGAEENQDSLDYMKVIAVGEGIEDLEPGDFILDMAAAEIPVYSINEVKYGLLYRGNVRIAVKGDNFDLEKEEKESSLNV